MAVPDAGALRVGDADRERVVGLLQRHYQAGRLTVAELEERTQGAYAAKTRDDLAAPLRDLPEVPSDAQVVSDQGATDGLRRSHRWKHYAAAAAGMVGIWALSGHGYFWPAWPILGWGLALAFGDRGADWDRHGRRACARRQRRGWAASPR